MPIPSIIAIDGPAASGKSTLGKSLAEALGYLYFDTGVMYRAVTWAALHHGLDVFSEAEITRLAETVQIDVTAPTRSDGRGYDVSVDGQDVTWDLRRPEVEARVSLVSAYSGVRQAMTSQQRRIGQRGKVVMVGRDIGTVVFPDADLKIYLVASAEERARRRYLELLARSEPADYETILSAMRARDKFDSTRKVAPLRPADDAITLDSDFLDVDQVLEKAKALVFQAV